GGRAHGRDRVHGGGGARVARVQPDRVLHRAPVGADVVPGRPVELVDRERYTGAGRRDGRQGGGRAELGGQRGVQGGRHRRPGRVERAGHRGEQRVRLQLLGAGGERRRVLPDRIGETEDQAGRVGRRLREVAGQQRLARGRVAARGRGGVA